MAVSQHSAALELLHDVMMAKRTRSTPLTSLEPIMLKFVELSVLLRKSKTAKEGLHQYKNISQNIAVATIEVGGVYVLTYIQYSTFIIFAQ
jgi:translation initiation factor 3 subunit A